MLGNRISIKFAVVPVLALASKWGTAHGQSLKIIEDRLFYFLSDEGGLGRARESVGQPHGCDSLYSA